jgi:endoglucanase
MRKYILFCCLAGISYYAQAFFYPGLPALMHSDEIRYGMQHVADSIDPDTTGMTSLTSVELSLEMIPGWNVGNSLEAIGGETSWGNPLINQRLIDSVKASGFKAIRIPVAWSKFSDTSTYTIKTDFMNRVREVVDYVMKDTLYAIINIHWDGGWMQPTYAMQDYVNNRLAIMWEQIALTFRDYDHHLLFAGTNEVHEDDNWGAPSKENYTVQNSFNQTFVNTVRATGGRNANRYLVVQGYVTNIDNTVSYFSGPSDNADNRLLVEVHYYDPYDFTINTGNDNIIQWGKDADNPARTETWANEPYANNQFLKMKLNFVEKGMGVVLGEYGAIARLNLGSDELNEEHAEYRKYYIGYITASIICHELIPFYWDNGYTGDHAFGLFNRSTGAIAYPDIVNAIMVSADTSTFFNTAIPDIGQIRGHILLYPNPVRSELNLELTDMMTGIGRMYNSCGQMLRSFSIERGNNCIPVGDLKSGLYMVSIETMNGMEIKKFIKE